MRRTACLAFFLLMLMVVLCVSGSAAERATRDYFGNPDKESMDLDEAAREMKQAIGEQIPASGGMFFFDPEHPDFELFDITGDGCADLCRCITWGSGMVRTDLVVYDPVEKKLYVLDGYNYNYLIDHVEEDRIVIAMEGPYGYNEPLVKTFGTVRMEDGRLVFAPDAEAQ